MVPGTRTKDQDVVEMPEEIAAKAFRQTGFHLTSKIFAAISLNIFFSFLPTYEKQKRGEQRGMAT